jgi:hypothetical protein
MLRAARAMTTATAMRVAGNEEDKGVKEGNNDEDGDGNGDVGGG